MYLLSTAVLPAFESGILVARKLTAEAFLSLLPRVTHNLCGHSATDAVLRKFYPNLPPAERGFWSGDGEAIAARPRGGVRQSPDVQVTLDDLEFVQFIWVRENAPFYPGESWWRFVRDISH